MRRDCGLLWLADVIAKGKVDIRLTRLTPTYKVTIYNEKKRQWSFCNRVAKSKLVLLPPSSRLCSTGGAVNRTVRVVK